MQVHTGTESLDLKSPSRFVGTLRSASFTAPKSTKTPYLGRPGSIFHRFLKQMPQSKPARNLISSIKLLAHVGDTP